MLKIACCFLNGELVHDDDGDGDDDDDDDDDDRLALLIMIRIRGVRSGALKVLLTIFGITLHLPRKMRAVCCWITFRSWFFGQRKGFWKQRDKVSIE